MRSWIMGSDMLTEVSAVPTALAALQGDTIYLNELVQGIKGLDIVRVAYFTSYLALAQATFTDYGAILYDNEDWPQTPLDEQLDPFHFYELASQVAEANDLPLIGT